MMFFLIGDSSDSWFFDTFIEPWTWEFMRTGLAITLIAAIVCAILSCWLILVGWSLMGDALSHAILPGIVLAYMFGVPFSVGALIAALVVVALIALIRRTSRVKEDTSIGVIFTTMFALGVMLISMYPTQISMEHILFGDPLGITSKDMYQVLVLGPIAFLLVMWKRRDLMLFAFDPTHAHAIGISTRKLSALLVVALSLTVVIAMQAVGAILIVALLITPGATAYLITSQFQRMLWVSPLISSLGVIIGFYVATWLHAAVGGTVVFVEGIIFVLVWIGSPHGLRGVLRTSKKHLLSETLPA
ncbi:MAG: metal ABC transporter permease [Actinomycetaceae bacterium]|nr:metal ABC transporter permease [Actinomycetaceae bacterium]